MSLDTRGALRLGLSTSYGADFEGGHPSTTGLDPSGAVVQVPLHRHEVEVDFVRLEFVGGFVFADGWELIARLPYDWKDRESSVRLLEPATPDEVAAIEASADSHHRSEHLEGFGDASLLVSRRLRDVWTAGDRLSLALGTTLPTGGTEDDPLAAGELGLPHEHVQFGSGTFDPLVELAWHAPIAPDWRIGSSIAWRVPLSRSTNGYRGPVEGSATLRCDYDGFDDVVLRAGMVAHGQGFADWNGERDENTGMLALGALLGASRSLGGGVVARIDFVVPLHQRALDDAGDAFESGLLVQVGVSWSGQFD